MSEEVTDHGLLDLSGLSLDTPLEESALADWRDKRYRGRALSGCASFSAG